MQAEPPNLETSVPDWLIEYPKLLRLFEQLRIDYSCGGKSLGVAALEAGVDPATLLKQSRSVI